MNARNIAALVALFLPPAAAAAPSPSARIQTVLAEAGLQGLAVSAFPEDAVSALQTPVSAAVQDGIVPPELWSSLPAPRPEFLDWLVARSPGLDPAMVREITAEAAEAIFTRALERGVLPIELFTDPGFRGAQVFYFPHAVVAHLFDVFELRVLTLPSGTAVDGMPFRMDALLAGGGKVEALYDRAYTAANPHFGGYTYNLSPRVVQVINGPGDVSVSGLSVNAQFRATIKRVVMIGAGEISIETNWGSRVRPVNPIRRRR